MLAIYGRLEATQLAQRCRLPLRQIRSGLAVLVQAQLVYHHTSSDQRTSYEANLQAAYDLIRNGKIIHLAKQTLGKDAALVVAHILSVGQVTMKDLRTFWKRSYEEGDTGNGRSKHGHGEDHNDCAGRPQAQPVMYNGWQCGRGDLGTVLKLLVQSGFVLRVRRAHFSTPADNYFDAQSELRSLEDGTATKSRKSQDELDGRVMQEIESRNDASISYADVIEGTSMGWNQPVAEGSESGSRKKTNLINGASSALHTAAGSNGRGRGPGAVCARISYNYPS